MTKKVSKEKEDVFTTKDALDMLEIIRSIKSHKDLSNEGALNLVKNGLALGKIAKNLNDVIKDLIEKIEPEGFQEKTDKAQRIRSKKPEDLTDEEKSFMNEYVPVEKDLTERVNEQRIELFKEPANVLLLKINEDDFVKILTDEKNAENITQLGFELFYKNLVA